MNFSEKMFELRKKEGLSQEELAEKVGVSRQTISKWEMGQSTPEMEKLVNLSKLFNLSLDELVGNDVINGIENKSQEDIKPKEIYFFKSNNGYLYHIFYYMYNKVYSFNKTSINYK